MKAYFPVWSALGLALGFVNPNQVYGEAGCLVIEIVMDNRLQAKEKRRTKLQRKENRLRACIREEK